MARSVGRLKKQHVNKISVFEMRILRCVYGKTLQDRIANENLRRMVGAAPIKDKIWGRIKVSSIIDRSMRYYKEWYGYSKW